METMNKITLEQLVVFLPYGLNVYHKEVKDVYEILGADNSHLTPVVNPSWHISYESIKPCVRPLSDYADINGQAIKELNENWFIEQEISSFAKNMQKLTNVNYEVVISMARNHIDIFNWIPKGLAVNRHNHNAKVFCYLYQTIFHLLCVWLIRQ